MNDLGASGLDLKCRSERFEAIGYAFGALGNRSVDCWRRRRRDPAVIDEIVGEQKGGEKQLTSFRQGTKASQGFAALGVDKRSGFAKRVLLAVAAGDLVRASSDENVDLRHQACSAIRMI
jgi:hypothetical protein